MFHFLQHDSLQPSHIVFSHSNFVAIGQCCRYTISVKLLALSSPPKLILSLKNLEFEAKKLLNVFGVSVYCQLIPCNFNQTLSKCPIPDDPYLIQVIQDVLPNEQFTAVLNFNENSKYTLNDDENNDPTKKKDNTAEYRWTLDVLSQVILINSQIIHYSLKISLSDENENIQNGNTSRIQSKADFTTTVSVATSDKIWNKEAPQPKDPIHLIILTHGIYSNAHCDMLYLKEELERYSENSNIMIRGFQGNVGHTEKGVRFLGTNLANYIDMLINTFPKIEKISFIGHSLGGITQSFAIFYLLNYSGFCSGDIQYIQPVKMYDKLKGENVSTYNPLIGATKKRRLLKDLTPINFVTLASPMLGTQYEFDSWINLGMEVGYLGKTGKDLALRNRFFSNPLIPQGEESDNENNGSDRIFSKPILEVIPSDLNFHFFMKRFKQRICFANIMNDGIVPLKTSSLLYLDYASLRIVDQLKSLRKENYEKKNASKQKENANGDTIQDSKERNKVMANKTFGPEDNSEHEFYGFKEPNSQPTSNSLDGNQLVLTIPPPVHSFLPPTSPETYNSGELLDNYNSSYSDKLTEDPLFDSLIQYPKKVYTSPTSRFFRNSINSAPQSPNSLDAPKLANSWSFVLSGISSPVKILHSGLKLAVTTADDALLRRSVSDSSSQSPAVSSIFVIEGRTDKPSKKMLKKIQRIQVVNNDLNYSLLDGKKHGTKKNMEEGAITSMDDRLEAVSQNEVNDDFNNYNDHDRNHVISQDFDDEAGELSEINDSQTTIGKEENFQENIISIPRKTSSIVSAINAIKSPSPEKSFFKKFESLNANDMHQILNVLYDNILWDDSTNAQADDEKTKLIKTYLNNMIQNGVIVHDKIYSYDELPPAYYNKTSYNLDKRYIFEEFNQEYGKSLWNHLKEKALLGKSISLNSNIVDENLPKEIENEDIPFLYKSKKSNFFSKRHVKSKQLSEKIARLYSFEKKWRKILVTLKPDAHNNIIVRRQFVNSYGWNVINYLVDIFEY